MRIAVCLKLVPDPATVEVDPLTGTIDPVRTLYMMNPADATALEMALRLSPESGIVEALTVGAPEADGVLRDALAVGVDHVRRLWDETLTETHPGQTATLLAAALRTVEIADLVLCGARSVDRATGKVPALLGEHLNWPVVTDVIHVELDGQRACFRRRLDRGARAEGEVKLPAVLGLEPGLVRLRHASLTGLMEAKRTAIPVSQLADLGLSIHDLNFARAIVHGVMPPRPRPRVIFMPDSSLAPHERIAQIMSAGASGKSGKVLAGGSADEMADAIIAFLRERGLLEQVS
jgi:electron transfer flavoprotein beta subunit